MDGNGRWARARGKPRIFGHRAGMETVRRTLTAARDIGVRWATLYAFSSENWSRPRAVVAALMHLLRAYIAQGVAELDGNGVRLQTSGMWGSSQIRPGRWTGQATPRQEHNQVKSRPQLRGAARDPRHGGISRERSRRAPPGAATSPCAGIS